MTQIVNSKLTLKQCFEVNAVIILSHFTLVLWVLSADRVTMEALYKTNEN